MTAGEQPPLRPIDEPQERYRQPDRIERSIYRAICYLAEHVDEFQNEISELSPCQEEEIERLRDVWALYKDAIRRVPADPHDFEDLRLMAKADLFELEHNSRTPLPRARALAMVEVTRAMLLLRVEAEAAGVERSEPRSRRPARQPRTMRGVICDACGAHGG